MAIAINVTAIIISAKIIHGRRLPIVGKLNESIRGAQMSLKVQGRIAIAIRCPVSSTVSPCLARYATKAVVINPQGNPWAKYRAHNVDILADLLSVKLVNICFPL